MANKRRKFKGETVPPLRVTAEDIATALAPAAVPAVAVVPTQPTTVLEAVLPTALIIPDERPIAVRFEEALAHLRDEEAKRKDVVLEEPTKRTLELEPYGFIMVGQLRRTETVVRTYRERQKADFTMMLTEEDIEEHGGEDGDANQAAGCLAAYDIDERLGGIDYDCYDEDCVDTDNRETEDEFVNTFQVYSYVNYPGSEFVQTCKAALCGRKFKTKSPFYEETAFCPRCRCVPGCRNLRGTCGDAHVRRLP